MTPSILHVSFLSHLLARNMTTLEQKLGVRGQGAGCQPDLSVAAQIVFIFSSLLLFFPKVQPPGG